MSGFSMVYVIYAAAALTGIMIAEAFYCSMPAAAIAARRSTGA